MAWVDQPINESRYYKSSAYWEAVDEIKSSSIGAIKFYSNLLFLDGKVKDPDTLMDELAKYIGIKSISEGNVGQLLIDESGHVHLELREEKYLSDAIENPCAEISFVKGIENFPLVKEHSVFTEHLKGIYEQRMNGKKSMAPKSLFEKWGVKEAQ